MTKLCDEAALGVLIRAVQLAPGEQINRIDDLLSDFPEDARLHLLRGSALLGEGRLIEGHGSMVRAVELAPDFAIARFQLGLFQLTSGEAANALETWGRLDLLPDGHYMRRFVDGLRSLIRDDFPGAIENLREGIRLNHENPPLNKDMQLVIDRCVPLIGAADEDASSVSETSFMLKQFTKSKSAN